MRQTGPSTPGWKGIPHLDTDLAEQHDGEQAEVVEGQVGPEGRGQGGAGGEVGQLGADRRGQQAEQGPAGRGRRVGRQREVQARLALWPSTHEPPKPDEGMLAGTVQPAKPAGEKMLSTLNALSLEGVRTAPPPDVAASWGDAK